MKPRHAAHWLALIAAAASGAFLLTWVGVPAPWLIAPLVVAIAASVSGAVDLRVPPQGFIAAQAAIGMLVAQMFTPPVVASIARSWPVMALVVASTIVAAGVAGWMLARFTAIAAPTAAFGSAPGGASAMIAMSAGYGADARIVAFMQYLRVTVVVLSASVVARMLLPAGAHPHAAAASTFDAVSLLETLAAGAAGAVVAVRLKIPAGALLGPMVLGALLHGTGIVRVAVPQALLDAAYVTIGLAIGLLYTRTTVGYALRVLPQLLASTVVLIALCCLSAALLVATIHVDALTAYLATTPGGLDSVTVIALGSGANAPLVLAVQALRIVVVIVTGPAIAKLIARIA